MILPLLANAYLNRLDWEVNERCELKPVMVRYADDFVILSSGQPTLRLLGMTAAMEPKQPRGH